MANDNFKPTEGKPEEPALASPSEPLVETSPAGDESLPQSATQVVAGAGGADTNTATEFLWSTHEYINEYIRFCDTKAGVVIVLASGVIAGMYAAQLHVAVFSKWPSQWGYVEGVSAAGFGLLAAAVGLAVWAIRPRLTNTQPQGFVFWNSIRGFRDAPEFWLAFQAQSPGQVAEHLASHLFTLAGVSRRKYFWVALSIWVGLLGAAAGAAAIVLQDVLPKGA